MEWKSTENCLEKDKGSVVSKDRYPDSAQWHETPYHY